MTNEWLEHLAGADLEVIAAVADSAGLDKKAVGSDPDALERVLADPALYDRVFGEHSQHEMVSPFLLFAILVHRCWDELARVGHVDEWVGPRQRLPVLGGGDLRAFLDAPERRLFVAELLASYTRVASGVTWTRTRRGWRRQRFSELDPVRLASLLDAVSAGERPGVYRRLGDLALFLTGVFPDHVETRGLGPIDAGRLARVSGLLPDAEEWGADGTVQLLARLGQRWYRMATRTASVATAPMRIVAEVGERFDVARRTLNYLTDRHLFVQRSRWFGEPA